MSGPVTFWLGFVFGVLAVWLLIGLALSAWLIYSLKGCSLAVVLLPLLLAGCAGNWLVLTTASYHENRERGYNERNPGVGIEHQVSADVRAMAGTYRNSHDRQSAYAGAQWTPLKAGGFSFGAAAIAASGYEKDRLVLFAAPMLSYETGRWGVNLLPATKSVIGLQVKLRIE